MIDIQAAIIAVFDDAAINAGTVAPSDLAAQLPFVHVRVGTCAPVDADSQRLWQATVALGCFVEPGDTLGAVVLAADAVQALNDAVGSSQAWADVVLTAARPVSWTPTSDPDEPDLAHVLVTVALFGHASPA